MLIQSGLACDGGVSARNGRFRKHFHVTAAGFRPAAVINSSPADRVPGYRYIFLLFPTIVTRGYILTYLYGKMSFIFYQFCVSYFPFCLFFYIRRRVATWDEASSATWDRIMRRRSEAAPITSGTRTVRVNATVCKLHNIDRDKTIAVIGID